MTISVGDSVFPVTSVLADATPLFFCHFLPLLFSFFTLFFCIVCYLSSLLIIIFSKGPTTNNQRLEGTLLACLLRIIVI